MWVAATLLAVGAFVSTRPAYAQDIQPPSARASVHALNRVSLERMPVLNNAALRSEAQRRDQAGQPFRFAEPVAVRITPRTHGTWETLDDGRRLWRLRVQSSEARSINLGFSRYVMPPGGELYLYAPGYTDAIGPFTSADNEAHGQLWTPALPGAEVVVEVVVPADQEAALGLELHRVNHGFRDVRGARKASQAKSGTSGSCNIDVACEEADLWRDQVQSVGAFSVNGTDICTGSLINNTAEDGRPFFLTAAHCGLRDSNAPSMVVYWNFQNSTCRASGTGDAGGDGDGRRDQFSTGAIFRADIGNGGTITGSPDASLVELDDPIPAAFNLFYAGWTREGPPPESSTTIHHPQVEEKRISLDFDPATITSYLRTNTDGSGATHIRVIDWDRGTTEPGSSGAPLFDANRRIVGVLSGGGAACGNDASDWYGRFSVAWNEGGASTRSLAAWLDPLGTDAVTLDGAYINDTEEDITAPAPVPDFTVATIADGSATLTWTATGDDGFTGRAASYDIRYATEPITLSTFADAELATGEPVPSTAGTSEEFAVDGLAFDTPYYFALVVSDEAGNTSDLFTTTEAIAIPSQRVTIEAAAPNPLRTQTTVRFVAAEARPVRATLYDILGRTVVTLYDETPIPGRFQELRIDGSRLASGVYFLRIVGEGFAETQKIAVVK